MVGIATLISAVAALITSCYGIYKDAKGHNNNVEKINTVAEGIPGMTEKLQKVEMGWKEWKDGNQK